tara:strand:- start:352 stop:711 length:360 start_codon:yes stop_codon:yes gene_type:complete
MSRLAPIGVFQALATLPWNEMVDLIEAAQEGGLDEDEAIQAAVELLDTMVDLSMLGPAGVALELVDAAILGAMLRLAWATQDPEAVEKRKARRASRRERRQERRADRKARRADREAGRG